MVQHKTLISLLSKGISVRDIAKQLKISSKTICENNKLYKQYNLINCLSNINDKDIENIIHPINKNNVVNDYIDYDYCLTAQKLRMFKTTELWNKYIQNTESINIKPIGYKNFWKKLNKHSKDFEISTCNKDRMYLTIIKTINGLYVTILFHPFSDTVYIKIVNADSFIHVIKGISNIFEEIKYIPCSLSYDKARGINIVGQCAKLYNHMINFYNWSTFNEPNSKFNDLVSSIESVLFNDLGKIDRLAKDYETNYNEVPVKQLKLDYCKIWNDKSIEHLFDPYIESSAAVGKDYHVKIENKRYSVPYEYYAKSLVKRVYSDRIEILFENEIIAEHIRINSKDKYNWYSTKGGHMPINEKGPSDWNASYFVNQARKYGPVIESTMRHMLKQNDIIEQSYITCMGFVLLLRKYSSKRIVDVCKNLISAKYISTKLIEGLLNNYEENKSGS